jgi:hypothetical protein
MSAILLRDGCRHATLMNAAAFADTAAITLLITHCRWPADHPPHISRQPPLHPSDMLLLFMPDTPALAPCHHMPDFRPAVAAIAVFDAFDA